MRVVSVTAAMIKRGNTTAKYRRKACSMLDLRAGVPAGRIGQAWSDAAYEERLARDNAAAAGIGITGIPTFIFDGRWIREGAVPGEMLREAAQKISAGES